ncbi:hypothetical protein [uncultured Croceitalea sp.]|uniref:hypothetical protein n=1 Tax=uncultured Croceitalea sp. TaxID=1798908 RepID=UPI00330567AD
MKARKSFFWIYSIFLMWGSSALGQTTFADNFNTISYSNNTGTGSFSGAWTETNDGGTPPQTNGRIRINSNQLRFQNMRDNRFITRNLDLSTFESAVLTLDYNRTGGNEELAVQLFDGSSFVTVAILNGTGSVSYTMNTNQISAASAIRIRSNSGDWDGGFERIFVDNVVITAQLPNQPPTVTAAGNQIYCAGTSLAVAETITITDPDDTTTNAVYIQISNGYVNGEDLLTLTGTHPNITSSWDAVQGELTLQGPALYTEFEAAILATEFTSSSPNPTGSRQFSITVGVANFLPATQHYYEFVSAPGISWTDAEIAAANRTYFGLQGYLVTLTSQEEADFSGAQASGFGWIGANDVAVEGEWRWVTGPEAGTLFWNGGVGGTEITFANWNGSEPNNCCGGEDYAHIADPSVIRGSGVIGSWNDLPNGGGGGAYASQGYVVEYGGMVGDPPLNISATTAITMDNVAPVWTTTAGALDENYECADDVPSLAACTSLNTTFFNEQQFSWGFGLQNSTGSAIPNWEVRITNADYQIDASQLTNQSAFTYSEIDNGDGTYDLIFTGTSAIAAFGGIPGGNIQWSGVNFGFDPSSDGISIFCGSQPFVPPVATDDCGTPTVSQISDVVTVFNSTNDFVRVITYEATDGSGNTSIPFTKTITVQDVTPPTASNPAAITVFCPTDVPAADTNVVTDEADNCDTAPTVTFVNDVSDGGSNPEVITRTYRVSDSTGNTVDVTQTITVSGITITTQPVNVTALPNNAVNFSVNTTNGDIFQWQVSTDGGSNYSDISDGTAYSGTQTNALSIAAAAVDTAKNGFLYRVLVSRSGTSCTPLASDGALLTVRVGTIITNRRITYRIKKN